MSQADFIERWCLNNVLAEVSSGADGSAVVRVHVVHVPPLNAVTVPVAT
jgi:hypothetical protein